MLSRIAEALYWMGRYLERADDTARLLDVHVHRMVVQLNDDRVGASLLESMGIEGEQLARLEADGPIDLWRATELLAYEGEIALVIGQTCRRVRPEEGWSKVSGITAANDWGLYDLRHADKGSNVKNKSGDGYTPLGPNVIPAAGLDPAS